jgi:hypothetical protein
LDDFRKPDRKLARFAALGLLKFTARNQPPTDIKLDRIFDPPVQGKDGIFTHGQEFADCRARVTDGDRYLDWYGSKWMIGARRWM